MSKFSSAARTRLIYLGVVALPLALLLILAGFARSAVHSQEHARQLVDRTFILKRDLALLLRPWSTPKPVSVVTF